MAEINQSAKLFNTALIATKAAKTSDCSAKLGKLVQSPAFQAILEAIQTHADKAKISEAQAAEEVVQTFRQIDSVWDDYIYQEGLNKLRGHLGH